MKPLYLQFRDFFVSLQLTVVLLILSIILVFVATLDQVNLGIWAVQDKYFRSFFVYWQVPGTGIGVPIFPGGYFIGGLLLINLISAHVYRFQLTWKKFGIQLAHSGLIILLLGELITGLMQKESMMRLDEGETKKHSESPMLTELVVIDRTAPEYDDVVAIPEAVLADKGTIQHPKLPFQLRLKEYFPNATLQMRDPAVSAAAFTSDQGIGTRAMMIPLPMTYKQDERNVPAALVEIVSPEGSLGTWMLSALVNQPQTFTHQGRSYEIALRFKRYYHPFSIHLLKFSHDRYPGTEIPKNFSSRVILKSDDGATNREVLIFMNEPLRFGGLTFYQAGFERNDRTTILQVVRNPGWLLPYIACVLMSIGLLWQFGWSLTRFVNRPRASA